MNIRNTTIDDKDFVVSSNDYVNQVSGIKTQSQLSINFEKDILCENPKAFCLIVEENKEQIAFCLYSYVYWANKGQGVYLSNVFVKPEYRKKGVLREILSYLKNLNNVNFITMLVGNENESMQKTIANYGAEDIDMKTFYLKKE
ncbi:MAG: GNAT family N-acetyltransferase [Clostridiales bacterium]|nr:GNAT family N-acetyltransferase [Clostridiales bacterium]